MTTRRHRSHCPAPLLLALALAGLPSCATKPLNEANPINIRVHPAVGIVDGLEYLPGDIYNTTRDGGRLTLGTRHRVRPTELGRKTVVIELGDRHHTELASDSGSAVASVPVLSVFNIDALLAGLSVRVSDVTYENVKCAQLRQTADLTDAKSLVTFPGDYRADIRLATSAENQSRAIVHSVWYCERAMIRFDGIDQAKVDAAFRLLRDRFGAEVTKETSNLLSVNAAAKNRVIQVALVDPHHLNPVPTDEELLPPLDEAHARVRIIESLARLPESSSQIVASDGFVAGRILIGWRESAPGDGYLVYKKKSNRWTLMGTRTEPWVPDSDSTDRVKTDWGTFLFRRDTEPSSGDAHEYKVERFPKGQEKGISLGSDTGFAS